MLERQRAMHGRLRGVGSPPVARPRAGTGPPLISCPREPPASANSDTIPFELVPALPASCMALGFSLDGS